MSTRLASTLHTGDVIRIGDWPLHLSADPHMDASYRVELDVAEFAFPLHVGWFQMMEVQP